MELICWLMTMAALVFLGCYVATSCFFFKFPHFLHGKKTPKFRCTHISHRGGAGENLENTMAAFDHAVATGTDMLEIDLQLTRDAVVVVSHDNNLCRTTGVDVDISQLNYDELPPLKATLPIDFDSSRVCTGGCDQSIPRLVDVFSKFPHLPINIDVKSENAALICKVSELVREYGREDCTVWGNFSQKGVQLCYKENPRISTFFSSWGVLKLALLTYTGLLPFVPLQEEFLEIFLPSIFERRQFGSGNQKRVNLARTVVWLVDKLMIRKAIFEHLRKRGIQTYLWVLNDDAEYERAFQLGASGVMTDYPTKLRDFLDRNPEYRSTEDESKWQRLNRNACR